MSIRRYGDEPNIECTLDNSAQRPVIPFIKNQRRPVLGERRSALRSSERFADKNTVLRTSCFVVEGSAS